MGKWAQHVAVLLVVLGLAYLVSLFGPLSLDPHLVFNVAITLFVIYLGAYLFLTWRKGAK